ncbi:MAG: FAD-binding oxidoreductase [Pseudomonadales bacterium]|jgi:glycine/D-amino acid oxidase-like deaminating enzyme|nr:FAD-binding oxidoreductase [Gammaproteobacteria bacterium]MBK9665440.1 FAD-binding oxidoreductase [Gammaproteobacteria bacterium]MBP6050450.1 FAD-binding oxidoreductase [Pseudomonadales bacterium]MBP6228064.1 FAD-binding oxidoreductase [Pseudomonadales bacterium]
MNQPISAEHCASYYAATRNDTRVHPPLEGSVRADVCIVGGGFTGVASALGLAERGYSVVLLEQNRIGWGASGRNGGQLIGGMSGQPGLLRHHGTGVAAMLREIGWRGNEIVETRIRDHAIDCDFRRGYLDVALKPRHMRDFAASEKELHSHAIDPQARLLDARELRAMLATDAYIGGLLIPRNGHLHPLNLCLGEARAAVALGARIFERSAVTEIVRGPRARVKTACGEVAADTVLLAGNAYQQLEQRRLGGLVFPAGSYIIATEPLSDAEANELNPHDLAVCDPNNVLDYFRFSAQRHLLFGGRCNYSGRESRSIRAAIMPRMRRIFPHLASKRVAYEWGGRIGIVVNRVPLLGRLDRQVFYAMGYSGHGVNFSHVAAEIMSDAIAGDMERMDVFARVPHRRIPFGQAFGNQLVALGMLYYRLRDLL